MFASPVCLGWVVHTLLKVHSKFSKNNPNIEGLLLIINKKYG
mgnify:CR=1 FL=1